MAQRRMIGATIQGSDAFRSLLPASQALFQQLWLAADDDGFVASPKSIVSALPRITLKHYRELVQKRFIIEFKTGVICIKHFLMLNNIKKDRYTPTVYIEERESLVIKPNRAYTEKKKMPFPPVQNGDVLETSRRHLGSVDKDRIEEDSIGKIDPRARVRGSDRSTLPESRKIVSLYIKFNPRYTGTVSEEKVKDFLSRHTMDEFEDLIAKAKRSDYLCGITGAPVMSLEWVLEEENFAAVMSGRYENWCEDKKAPESFDSDAFFQAAVARGRKTLGKKT